MKRLLIILPTYNEREDIKNLVDYIFGLSLNVKQHILIIDDNSPDGTGKLVDELYAGSEFVHIIHRLHKQGLGSAYIEGFKYALRNDFDYVCEMDADFSHHPQYLHTFCEKIEDADLVIGSRYTDGVSIVHWPFSRLVKSYFANKFVKLVTGLPFTDSMGGYKCFRCSMLKEIDLDRILSKGYVFQMEMLYRVYRAGGTVVEIPIIFYNRKHGKSKMATSEVMESFFKVLLIRFTVKGRSKNK